MSNRHEAPIILHNATPHPTDFLGEQEHYNVPISGIFQDSEGHPLPIRAAEEVEDRGTLQFVVADTLQEFPVAQRRMTGLENVEQVHEQIRQVSESDPESRHIIIVSQIAYAALVAAEVEVHLTESSNVGFAFPAGIRRDGDGKILYASRLDQPRPTSVPPLGDDMVKRRQGMLLTLPPWNVKAHNYTPQRLLLRGSVLMNPTVIAQPAYDTETIDMTPQGTPITMPELRHIVGESSEPGAYFVHLRFLTIARRLGREDIVGRSFVPRPSRDEQGNLTQEVEALDVYHPETLEALASTAT